MISRKTRAVFDMADWAILCYVEVLRMMRNQAKLKLIMPLKLVD